MSAAEKQQRHEVAATPAQLDYRISRLRAASDIVRGVALTLNDASGSCQHCGLKVLEDVHEARQRDQLDGIVQRLERIIGSLVADEQAVRG